MNEIQVNFHLVYVGKDQFQLTISSSDRPANPIIEIMTFGQLQQSIRGMKPGARMIRFAKSTIDCANTDLDALRGYFVSVYDSIVRAKAGGRDLDAELKEINRPDLTDGSGGLCMN